MNMGVGAAHALGKACAHMGPRRRGAHLQFVCLLYIPTLAAASYRLVDVDEAV